MKKILGLNHEDLMSRCRAYITSLHQAPKGEKKIYPSITISRLSGAGAFVIGQQLVEELNKKRKPEEPVWTLFDKNLVHQIIEDHKLPQSLEKYYSDAAKSRLEDLVEEFLDLHPEEAKMVEQTARTIIKLMGKGHVVILGRAGNIIARHFKTVLHVRLVASLEFRLRHTVATCGLSAREATNFIQRADAGRAKYFKRYFDESIDDPLLYDMILNTESLGFDETMKTIMDVVLSKVKVKIID